MEDSAWCPPFAAIHPIHSNPFCFRVLLSSCPSDFLTRHDAARHGTAPHGTAGNKPMDLSTLQQRVLKGKYTRVDKFESDLKMIHWNCAAFCKKRFPKLPKQVRYS
jgi:hypothetical protein